jgi:hypothetical protein
MKGYRVKAGKYSGYYGFEDDYLMAQSLLETAKKHDPDAFIEEYEYESTSEKCDRLAAENVELRARCEAAEADLKMVCTVGEICASCHWCCNRGPDFPCAKHDEWCKGTAWQWRGANPAPKPERKGKRDENLDRDKRQTSRFLCGAIDRGSSAKVDC